MAFEIKRYLEILADIQAYIIAHQDKISDFNEGSVISSKIEAFSRTMESLYIRVRKGFEQYLSQIPYKAFNFTYDNGQAANGEVIFSRTVTGDEISIPTGTIIATSSGLQFITTEDATIGASDTDSDATSIVADDVGINYNVPASTITVLVSPIVGVETVNNTNPTTGGIDEESEYEYLQRFREYINGLGKSNGYGIKTGAKTVSGVRSVSIDEHFPPEDDLYNFTLYIDDGSGEASSALLAEVEAVIEGSETSDDPGYRAVGIKVRYLAPTKVTIDVTVTITDDNIISEETITYNVETAITEYINNLLVGEDMIVKKLEASIINVNGVEDISMSTPTTNETIGNGQIARVGTITINYA